MRIKLYLEVPPPMNVQRILYFLLERHHFKPLLRQIPFQVEYLAPKIAEISRVLLQRSFFELEFLELELKQAYLVESLTVLLFAPLQRLLEDLDLPVLQTHLVVAPDYLRADDVALIHHRFDFFALPSGVRVSLLESSSQSLLLLTGVLQLVADVRGVFAASLQLGFQ